MPPLLLRILLSGPALFAPVLFTACSSARPVEFVAPEPDFKSFAGRPVSVAAPLFASEISDAGSERAMFDRNVYCGTIQFSGGYVRGPAEQGGRIQNRLMTLALEDETKREAARESAAMLEKAFAERGLQVKPLRTQIHRRLLTLDSELDYRSRPDEGRDSINLPLLRFHGGPTLNTNAVAALMRSAGHEGYVVIPVILRYFRHNAGWFNGQEIGAYAGARIAIKLLVYDLRSGARVFDEDYEQKRFAVGRSIVNPNEYYRMIEEIRQDILGMLIASLPAP